MHPELTTLAVQAARVNPCIVTVVTERGGHVGWMAGNDAHAWLPDVALDFITAAISM